MKLGGKQGDVDSFVDQLVSEGEKVSAAAGLAVKAAGGLSKVRGGHAMVRGYFDELARRKVQY